MRWALMNNLNLFSFGTENTELVLKTLYKNEWFAHVGLHFFIKRVWIDHGISSKTKISLKHLVY